MENTKQEGGRQNPEKLGVRFVVTSASDHDKLDDSEKWDN